MKRVSNAIFFALATTSGSALASSVNGKDDALASCVDAVERELALTNFDAIDRRMGVNKVRHDVYEFYLNVKLRGDSADNRARPVKVYCRSAGFAKVRELRTSEGAWVYKTRRDQILPKDSQVAASKASQK